MVVLNPEWCPATHTPLPTPVDETGGGFTIDASSVSLASGTCYVAKVVVRRLPSEHEMFCDCAINGGRGWPTPHEALAVALARGRRYVREQVCVAARPAACTGK